MSGEQKVQELVSIFICHKDKAIEKFLKSRAIEFEGTGKSRTFFIYDEDEKEFTILAYFTIALQVLKIPESLSNRKIKIFDGFNAKINGEKITEFPAILIGQLGKNSLYEDKIAGSEIMQYCLSTILAGQERLGGRIIMPECKDIPALIGFYNSFGFEKIEKDYGKEELIQFVRILSEDELIEKLDAV